MTTLVLLVAIGVMLGYAAFTHRESLGAHLAAHQAARHARMRRTGERAARMLAFSREQAREAVFGSQERRWRGWVHWFREATARRRARKAGTPVPAPAAAPAAAPSLYRGAMRMFTLVLMSVTALANLAVEMALLALTNSEYLGDPGSYGPVLARLFAAPAVLIAVSVLAGTTVWGILGLESLGVEAPTFDTPWMGLLSPLFLGLGIWIVSKAGEVRGLAGMPAANGAAEYQLMHAAASAKLDISVGVAVMAVGTSVIGLLALSRLVALGVTLLLAGCTAAAAAAMVSFALVRHGLARVAWLPVELFLVLVGVPRPKVEPLPSSALTHQAVTP
jgi:hypothetical protein